MTTNKHFYVFVTTTRKYITSSGEGDYCRATLIRFNSKEEAKKEIKSRGLLMKDCVIYKCY